MLKTAFKFIEKQMKTYIPQIIFCQQILFFKIEQKNFINKIT